MKISLDGITPKIYRQFVVPTDISLDRLHDIIQIVMDWKDYHLHEFDFDGKKYTEDPESEEDGAPESKVRLNQMAHEKGDSFSYLYDFGDSWQHTITVEKVEAIPPEYELRISCLGGKNAAPPEDVGGVGGYEHFLKTISNPKDPEHKEMIEWSKRTTESDDSFDPRRFDMDRINLELLKYVRWSRVRQLPWESSK